MAGFSGMELVLVPIAGTVEPSAVRRYTEPGREGHGTARRRKSSARGDGAGGRQHSSSSCPSASFCSVLLMTGASVRMDREEGGDSRDAVG